MSDLRRQLEEELRKLPELTIAPWKDSHLICLFYCGREFAHFHGETILDIRLSPKIIRQEQLDRSVSEQIHPARSKNSRWIGVGLKSEADVKRIVRLVQLACSELGAA